MATTKERNVYELVKLLECPICAEVKKTPIQCQTGHSMCQACVEGTVIYCPICERAMTRTRNLIFEQMIHSIGEATINKTLYMKQKCKFKRRGCKFILDRSKKTLHESECRFRDSVCEGAIFCGWKCDWVGPLSKMVEHFNIQHKENIGYVDHHLDHIIYWKVNFTEDKSYIRLVNYQNGQHYFWYKCRADMKQQKAFLIIQMIGTREASQNFTYTMTFTNGPNKKLMAINICSNDASDIEEIFENEKCMVMSFKCIKHFLNEKDEMKYSFSIQNAQKYLENCRDLYS